MCAALATIRAKAPSLRIFHTGVQYTPVASIATWLHRHTANHASNASRPSVVVAKVRHSRVTLLRLPTRRTQATTVSLCTSNPATRLCITSILSPPHLRRRRGGLAQNEI